MSPQRLLLIALAALALAPAAASAATVSMTNHGLVVDSSGDGDSRATFTIGVESFTPHAEIGSWGIGAVCDVFSNRTCLSAGPGCRNANLDEFVSGGGPNGSVICDRTSAGITVYGGGGDDRVEPRAGSDPVTVDLGDGNDTLVNETGSGAVGPTGSGAWTVTGGPGNDRIQGSSGGNTVDAGSGNDIVKTFPTGHEIAITSKLTVSSETRADRPELSGDDTVFAGSGDDTVDMGNGSDAVSGGTGDDTFAAGPDGDVQSTDAYDGGPNFDTIDYSKRTTAIFFDSGSTQSGANTTSPHELDRDSGIEHVLLGSGDDMALSLFDTATRRTFEGGTGDDLLNGLDSNDTLVGGPGKDRLNGFGGNDALEAVDGTADQTISCGDGSDVAHLDLHDPNPVDANKCETITREAVKEAPVVRIVGARRAAGAVRVTLACPAHNDRACAGRLDVGAGTAVAYSISRGATRTVGLPRTHGARVRVRSVEHGRYGLKTVIRTLTVS